MKYTLHILRRASRDASPEWTSYEVETDRADLTLASALSQVNEGLPAEEKVAWDCSCLQKKCGACAMVVNGTPALACDTRLQELKGDIRVEPLRKFPVIRDLVTDRSVLQENLSALENWLTVEAPSREDNNDLLYEASRCLQCGCCLEVCPNFYPGGNFFGMAAMVPVSRLLEELPKEEQTRLRKQYQKHGYSGCGKSLACRNICPAGIDIDGLLVNSNALALWKKIWNRT